MKRSDVDTSTRLAGLVLRYHTWPTIHKQTVGEHTWQTIRLYWELYDVVPPEVTAYLLWHDASELYTGDIPFPVKKNDPQLKRLFDDMEDMQLTRMIGQERMQEVLGAVSDLQRLRMKGCDLLCMHEFGWHEWRLGNSYAEPIISDTAEAIYDLSTKLPASEQELLRRRVRLLEQPAPGRRGEAL